jgi:hypothetical protein
MTLILVTRAEGVVDFPTILNEMLWKTTVPRNAIFDEASNTFKSNVFDLRARCP